MAGDGVGKLARYLVAGEAKVLAAQVEERKGQR